MNRLKPAECDIKYLKHIQTTDDDDANALNPQFLAKCPIHTEIYLIWISIVSMEKGI